MVRCFSRWSFLGLIAIAPVLGGADAGCSARPTGSTGGSGGGGSGCTTDANCPVPAVCKLCPDGSCAPANVHCVSGACSAPNYTCQTSGSACTSSQSCNSGEHCTTEDGACNRPPGCDHTAICPAVCYGVCTAATTPCSGKPCGATCAGPFASPLPTYCDANGQCSPMAAPPVCGAPDCSKQEATLTAFIKANKQCSTAADCQTFVVGCGVSDDGCTGSVYVNQSTNSSAFSALATAFSTCASGSPNCVVCKRLTRPPACISGQCQPSSG